MKKKILSVLLVAVMLFAIMPLLSMATDGTAVDSEESLRAALEKGGEIVLADNITLDENSGGLVIAKGVEVTLDLAGYTLSREKTETATGNDYLITNKGTLTVKDSSTEGTGKLLFTYSGAQKANSLSTIGNIQGTVHILGGTVENATATGNGSYAYAIDNQTNGASGHATLTVSGGIIKSNYDTIRQCVNGSSKNNTLNISGGEIISTNNRAILVHDLNDYSGKTLNNAAVLNITGGVMTCLASDYVFMVYAASENLSISGGTFHGYIYDFGMETGTVTKGYIAGGSFPYYYYTYNYLADGYLMSYEKGTYNVVKRTGAAVDVPTEVAPGVSTGSVSAENTGITDNQVSDAVNNATTQQDLQNAAFNMQNKVSVVGTKESALEALKRENPEATFDESAEVKVEVNPYLQMDIQQYQSAGETKTVTVEIDAKYTVVASSGSYSACVGEGDMKVTEPITITVPLPDGFVTDASTKVYVHHYKNGGVYTYEATVEETAEGYVATFVNPNGFSTFEFSTSEKSSIDPLPGFAGTNLALEAAIDIRFWIAKDLLNAPEGAYAKIITSGTTVTVNRDQWMQREENGVTYYLISCTSMAAKTMCDEIQVTVYNAQGEAISQTLCYTIAQAIVDLHNTTNDANYKDLCVAMLNYGAAAQVAFKYNTDELATKYLAALAGANG